MILVELLFEPTGLEKTLNNLLPYPKLSQAEHVQLVCYLVYPIINPVVTVFFISLSNNQHQESTCMEVN